MTIITNVIKSISIHTSNEIQLFGIEQWSILSTFRSIQATHHTLTSSSLFHCQPFEELRVRNTN